MLWVQFRQQFKTLPGYENTTNPCDCALIDSDGDQERGRFAEPSPRRSSKQKSSRTVSGPGDLLFHYAPGGRSSRIDRDAERSVTISKDSKHARPSSAPSFTCVHSHFQHGIMSRPSHKDSQCRSHERSPAFYRTTSITAGSRARSSYQNLQSTSAVES
ncbi:hypothetical protein BV22DRAFT_911871 [Leucogyrophana mollusca]|uniref:Uncharacterized protein n=1 Tax=Leucogyrophana mollusca TaxID=85980 RepID=A0ACB8AZA2_9AGAM|nr:hypothetical protein BV22DRAFT_911871 [Leucogyrophana mollusca]